MSDVLMAFLFGFAVCALIWLAVSCWNDPVAVCAREWKRHVRETKQDSGKPNTGEGVTAARAGNEVPRHRAGERPTPIFPKQSEGEES